MEQHITLFFILFSQASATAFLCLHTAKDSLKIPFGRALLAYLSAITGFSALYAFIPPLSVWNVAIVSVSIILGWVYLCFVSTADKGKLFFILTISVTHLLLCNTVWILLIDAARSLGDFYSATSYYDILFLGIALFSFLPLFSKYLQTLWSNAKRLTNIPWYRLSLIPLTFCLIYVALYLLRSFGYNDSLTEHIVMVTVTICFFTTTSQLTFALRRAAQAARYEQTLRLAERQIKLQSARMEELAAHRDEIRRIRHDIRQHINVIHALLAEKKPENAMEYIGQVLEETSELPPVVFCENEAVDSILRHYQHLAAQNGAHTEISVMLAKHPGVRDTDLCVLLGNLLENAIEACTKNGNAPHGKVELQVRTEGGRILISLNNTYNGEIRQNGDGVFLSTKDNSMGLGLTSVKSIAEKYKGWARFQHRGNLFTSEVLLYTGDDNTATEQA